MVFIAAGGVIGGIWSKYIIKLNYHLEIILFVNIKMSFAGKSRTSYKKPTNRLAKEAVVASQSGLYNQILITRRIAIKINNIGNTIKETLEKVIAEQIEGKCIVEGFIKPYTTEVITFSSGLVKGEFVLFEVVFQCLVCLPVEGMQIKCVAKHINKAGIRAEINEQPTTPLVIFIARDHNYASPFFAQVKENDEIKIRVIGQRFELNDKYISVIAELVENAAAAAQQKKSLLELGENDELVDISKEIEKVSTIKIK